MATAVASENGLGPGAGGLCDNPHIGPVGIDGEFLPDASVFDPSAEVTGFRAEFTFASKI
jgi:hypothetical protein